MFSAGDFLAKHVFPPKNGPVPGPVGLRNGRVGRSPTTIIRDAIAKSGWTSDEARWVIPHQANGRILKAAAKRSGIAFDRFYLNVDHVGNTSSASIPIAIVEMEERLEPSDKLILCSVGAGMTTAAIAVEW